MVNDQVVGFWCYGWNWHEWRHSKCQIQCTQN